MQLSTHADIASRAYSIWEQEGRPQGRELAHWLQAERELAEGGRQSKTSGDVATAKGRAQGRTAKAGTTKTAKPKKATTASRKPKK